MAAYKIKSTNVDEVKFGDSIQYFTGNSAETTKRDSIPIRRKNKDNKPIYKTGLSDVDIKFNPYLTKEEKEAWSKKLPEIRELLKASFGEEALDEDNEMFWKEKGNIEISNATLDFIYDEANPENLLKKVMIYGGCFDLIAPTLNAAKRSGGMIQYYLIDSEQADEISFEKRGEKPLAYELYAELKSKSNKDALLYLCWVLHTETMGFTHKTAPFTLQAKLEDYIEGEFTKAGTSRKLAASRFVDYAKKWKADKTEVISEAVVNAAEHFGLIFFRTDTNMWHSSVDDIELGNSLEKARKFLLEARNRDALLKLKELVDIELNK